MEDPRLLEEGYFWFNRQQNGWHPVPENMLLAAEEAVRLEKQNGGMAYTFCGVPVQELTEREAKAALVLLLQEMFKPKIPDPFAP